MTFESNACSTKKVKAVSRGAFLFLIFLGRSKGSLLAGYSACCLVAIFNLVLVLYLLFWLSKDAANAIKIMAFQA